MKEITVFISHPSDVEKECKQIKDIIQEQTRLHFYKHNFQFIPKCHVTHSFPDKGRPQDIINPLIEDEKCELVVTILWAKFGSDTGKFSSGIEEELKVALMHSKDIKIYFLDFPIKPSKIELSQLARVLDFKEKIIKEKNFYFAKVEGRKKLLEKFKEDFSNWGYKYIESGGTKIQATKKEFRPVRAPKKIRKGIKDKFLESSKGFS